MANGCKLTPEGLACSGAGAPSDSSDFREGGKREREREREKELSQINSSIVRRAQQPAPPRNEDVGVTCKAQSVKKLQNTLISCCWPPPHNSRHRTCTPHYIARYAFQDNCRSAPRVAQMWPNSGRIWPNARRATGDRLRAKFGRIRINFDPFRCNFGRLQPILVEVGRLRTKFEGSRALLGRCWSKV